jgi:pilus assembly protein CpaB
MASPLSPESSAGGFVLPGDHVDVIQTRKLEGNQVMSATVLKNVKVLAIDQNTSQPAKTGAALGATATLEVAPDQAEVLIRARAQGDLYLILRSYADTSGPAVLGGRSGGGNADVVKVYRNASATEVRVAR